MELPFDGAMNILTASLISAKVSSTELLYLKEVIRSLDCKVGIRLCSGGNRNSGSPAIPADNCAIAISWPRREY
jgi:hypothetical protein